MRGVGLGVSKDYAERAKEYRRSAEQGAAPSQYELGVLYMAGKGVPKDYVLAHMWLNLAAARGHRDAAKVRNAIVDLITPEQIAESQKLAREWRREFE